MAGVKADPDEALTRNEITSTEVPDIPQISRPQPRNAFGMMMSRKDPEPKIPEPPIPQLHKRLFKDRSSLGAYIAYPESYPLSLVLYYDDSFVVLNDLYPKASVHTLLLTRSTTHSMQHPFDAFEDATFLAEVRIQTDKLKRHVAKELQRKFGKYSAQDAEREAVLNGEKEVPIGEDGKPKLPVGRDWEKEVMVGIHAGPSMKHLHVHVLSRDMFSERLKHRKHYNSFHTPFLVDVADFPLAKDDARRHRKSEFLGMDLVCWRCGKNFARQFAKLKAHLAEEFEDWKKE